MAQENYMKFKFQDPRCIGRQPGPFAPILSMAAFLLYQQSSVMELRGAPKPRMFRKSWLTLL